MSARSRPGTGVLNSSLAPSRHALAVQAFRCGRWPDLARERWGLSARLPRWRAFDGRRSRVAMNWTGSSRSPHVEELIDQVFFDADVPRQHVRNERICKHSPVVQQPRDLRLLERDDGAVGHCRSGCHSLRLTRQTTFTEEMACIDQGDHGLFPCVRHGGQPYCAFLDVHDARSRISLGKDGCRGCVLEALRSHVRPVHLDRIARRCLL